MSTKAKNLLHLSLDIRHVHSAVGKEILASDGTKDYHSFLEHLFNKFSLEDIEHEIIDMPHAVYEKAKELTVDLFKLLIK